MAAIGRNGLQLAQLGAQLLSEIRQRERGGGRGGGKTWARRCAERVEGICKGCTGLCVKGALDAVKWRGCKKNVSCGMGRRGVVHGCCDAAEKVFRRRWGMCLKAGFQAA